LAKLKGFAELWRVEEALQTFLAQVQPQRLGLEKVPLKKALHRVAGEDMIAKRDLPHFARSAMDGYAVKAGDTFGVSEFKPTTLRLVRGARVSHGEAARVWTGSAMPAGADAVVMLEYTREAREGRIEVLMPVVPGMNVSPIGEDLHKGDMAVRKGKRLRPEDIGLLTALGYTEVDAIRKPRVGLLSTGNELVEPRCPVKPGKVVNVNRILLDGMVRELGGEPVDLGIAKDDLETITQHISKGLKKTDILLTTGGTSVGGFDLVPEAVNRSGKPGLIIHGIAMRPGKPTGLAIVNDKPVVLLSGNPVAAIFGFDMFVRPLIQKMLGIEYEPRPTVQAKLTRKVPSALGVMVFLRVKVYLKGEQYYADPLRTAGAGVLTTMTKASGYVIIPEDRADLEEGEIVTVHLTGSIGRT